MIAAIALCLFTQDPKTDDAAPPRLSTAEIANAVKVAGLEFSEADVTLMQKSVIEHLESAQRMWKLSIDNSIAPAITFDPLLPGMRVAPPKLVLDPIPLPEIERPENLEELAYASIPELASLIRSRKVMCTELTATFVMRLRRLDHKLHCVVNLTEERAMAQARALDAELQGGKWRGLLHGIPWGAKDLLAVKGTPTTWGSKIYAGQMLDLDATVVKRLDDAGAILIAKLSLGEIAMGDKWFGGLTRNPWNPDKGSSGSSAGSASATVAGCVAFAIGSETLGSIVSPSSVCGATGLRPTFGRVSRHGAMALSWTMDKIGPLARSAEDCAIVLAAIRGPDGLDGTVHDVPFTAGRAKSVKELKVGYPKGAFTSETHKHVLEELKALGVEPVEIELPKEFLASDLLLILSAEAAAAFDAVTRSGDDDKMVAQDEDAWPNTFRAARLIPAVEYIRANRLRTKLMRDMDELMKTVDVYVHPSRGNASLTITNLTGHPAIAMPDGFDNEGRPRSISFTGRLYGESDLCALARAWQESTDYHRKHPKL